MVNNCTRPEARKPDGSVSGVCRGVSRGIEKLDGAIAELGRLRDSVAHAECSVRRFDAACRDNGLPDDRFVDLFSIVAVLGCAAYLVSLFL